MAMESGDAIYRNVRQRRLSKAYEQRHEHFLVDRLSLRNIVIAGALFFTLALALYVSIPDFPYSHKAWQVNLWSDSSGWWSEMTWILAFGLFTSLAILFRSWFHSLKPGLDLIRRTRLGVILTAVSWDSFAIVFLVYFKPAWPGFYKYFMLDRTGTLHGLFYIGTAHVGVLAAIFGLALSARIVDLLRSRTCGTQ